MMGRRRRRRARDYRGTHEIVVYVIGKRNVRVDRPVLSRGGHLADIDESLRGTGR